MLFFSPYNNPFLEEAHDQGGYQGTERSPDRLLQTAYWVGMAKDVNWYCSHCLNCQTTKAQPYSLQRVIASQPWELVAVDVLKVPVFQHDNQYTLIAQV